MEEWYYIISNEPHKKYYCDDYEDVQSSISLDSIFKIPINKYLDDIILKDENCPDYSIYKDGELIEVITGKTLTEIYLEKNCTILEDYLNKKQKKELMCKKVVDNFSSLSSNIEGINNEMKNLTDKLNKLSDIF